MAATKVTMQGIVTTPAGGARNAVVLIELITDPGQVIPGVGYVDADDTEAVGTVSVTADPDSGVWSTLLYQNADIRPVGTYYRARYIVDGIEHPPIHFEALAGGGWVGDHLIQPPDTIEDASSAGRQLAYQRVDANVAISSATAVDIPNAAVAVQVGARPIMVEFYCSLVLASVADQGTGVLIVDVTGGGTIVAASVFGHGSGGANALGGACDLRVPLDPLPAAGLRTYKTQAYQIGGGTRTFYGDAFVVTPTTMFMRAVES